MVDNVVILIPAYNPDEGLLRLIERLSLSFSRIVVVNDGSNSGTDVFRVLTDRVTAVLVHSANRGKGAALKTGFAWISAQFPDIAGVVTADADGQHTPEDITRIAAEVVRHPDGIILGVRSFSGNVPFRSRFGNMWARGTFFLVTGLSVRDTQTGLRGIPRALLPRMTALPGDRYEYEMRMLADARCHASPPIQVPIETVYIGSNETSHFHPIRDGLRTQWVLVHYCLSSVLAFLLDNAVFTAALLVLRQTPTPRSEDVLIALCISRFVSANLNFFYNRFFVFHSASTKRSFFQYWGVVLAVAAASWFGTSLLSQLLDVDGLWITVVKIAVETGLFSLSYQLQRKWIFRSRRRARR